MTLPGTAELAYPDGQQADPVKITDLARFLENANSRGLAASLRVKTSPGLLFGFTVYNSGPAQNIQLFDLSGLPADTAVPLLNFPVAADTVVGVTWTPSPRGFEQGIVLCNSTTDTTKTLGAVDCFFDAQYL